MQSVGSTGGAEMQPTPRPLHTEALLPPTPAAGGLLDDVINRVGLGVWTMTYFVLATLIPMSMLVNLLVAEFTAVEVDFTCAMGAVPVLGAAPVISGGSIEDDTRMLSASFGEEGLPLEGGMSNACYLPISDGSNGSSNSGGGGGGGQRQPCTHFVYDNSTFANTITTEFELVCDREWQRSLFQMLFTLGCLAGAPVGGVLADKFGRQKAMWYGCVWMVLLTVLLTAVPVLWVVFLSRFLLGFFTDIVFIASVTIGMEVCPSNFRHAFGTVESLPYAVMLPVLAAIAYLCRRWRQVQLWASLPLFAATALCCPLLLDESPRWLVSKGRLEEAETVVRRAARLNRRTKQLPHDLAQVLAKTYKNQTKTTYGGDVPLKTHIWSLVSTGEMRTITLALTVLWFFEGTLYISLPLNASSYESPFLYLALLGLLEVPGTLVVTPLGGRFGRKMVGITCAVITAIMMAVMAGMRAYHYHTEWLLVTLAVVAYITLVGVSQMTLLLTSELFPTTVRSLGSSLGFFMNNLGYCMPPLMEMILPASRPELTLGVYSVMALSTAALLLLLPETSGRPLYETVAEHVQREREEKSRRSSVIC